MICNKCPRKCNVDRSINVGVCGVGEMPRLAKAYLHKWEEPVITGKNGSGTVFFSGCNLKCIYCQNYKISHENYGKYITYEKLAEIFKKLESEGASNINLVSPTHYVEAIKKALDIYRPNIPIVYNSSGYDSVETIEELKDYIDIFLVDFKYFDSELSNKLSKAPDYPEVAKSAILKMREIIPEEIYDGDVLKKGVLIRHLVLPNHTDDSIKILEWIKDNIKNPFISLMGQYTPMYKSAMFEDINRVLKPIEYKIVLEKMLSMGLTNGFTQELSSASDCYTPVFDCEGV
jgi:putative pyruvate formate lyase activating enzyme